MMNAYKKTLLALTMTAAIPVAHAASIDLTPSSGLSGIVNNAVFFNPDNTGTVGTGTFNTFVRIQANGQATTQSGFNTDGAVELDTKNGIHTHSIQLGSIGGETYNSVSYRVFILDINQAGGSNISLDSLQIFLGSTPSPSGYTGSGFTNPASSSLVYNLDGGSNNEVLLNAAFTSGSGNGFDMKVLIPDSVFAGRSASDYLYLFSAFGGKGGNFVANGGFEEWSATEGQFIPPRTNVPEPVILSLLAASLFGFRLKQKTA